VPDRDFNRDGAREQIHLPGPSVIPLVTAAALTVTLVGLILSWWFVLAGGIILVIAVSRWIRLVREDMASLPTERR
jgi:Cytochrome c oxidase subunit IV